MSALGAQLGGAGFRSAQDILDAVADAALLKYPQNITLAGTTFISRIRHDPELLLLAFSKYVADASRVAIEGAQDRARKTAEKTKSKFTPITGGGQNGSASNAGHPPRAAAGAPASKPTQVGQPIRGGGHGRCASNAGHPLRAAAAKPIHATVDRRPSALPSVNSAVVAHVQGYFGGLLESFVVNGRPFGDITPAEAREWAESQGRQANEKRAAANRQDLRARFALVAIHGVPEGRPVREFVKPADLDVFAKRIGFDNAQG